MYLLSGFELELYSIHEYIYIYWYLSQFLYNWIVSTLNRAECLVEHAKNAIKQQKKTKPNKKKTVSPNYRELILNQSLSNMFNGYFKALAGFTKEDRIPQPLPGKLHSHSHNIIILPIVIDTFLSIRFQYLTKRGYASNIALPHSLVCSICHRSHTLNSTICEHFLCWKISQSNCIRKLENIFTALE